MKYYTKNFFIKLTYVVQRVLCDRLNAFHNQITVLILSFIIELSLKFKLKNKVIKNELTEFQWNAHARK